MSVMDIHDITKMLPHSYPFLLLDRVEHIEDGVSITGYKNITFNEPCFTGHFPERPIMPGVMIIEALAQLSGILAMRALPDAQNNIFFLAGVNQAKFKKIVIPGDKLQLHSVVTKQKSKIWKFACQATVDGALACSAEIMIAKE